MQIETPVEEEHRAVAAVELNQLLAPFDPARVVGHRDDELEDDVIGQKIEEVLAFGQPIEPCLDHPEERLKGPEVLHVFYSDRPSLLSGLLTRPASDLYGIS